MIERCESCKWWFRDRNRVSLGECHGVGPIGIEYQSLGLGGKILPKSNWATTLGDDFCRLWASNDRGRS